VRLCRIHLNPSGIINSAGGSHLCQCLKARGRAKPGQKPPILGNAFTTLVDEDANEKKIFQIVGEGEADVKAGRVSTTSPTAR
jgi:Transcription elongation factor, GreA/GreB, C-term